MSCHVVTCRVMSCNVVSCYLFIYSLVFETKLTKHIQYNGNEKINNRNVGLKVDLNVIR